MMPIGKNLADPDRHVMPAPTKPLSARRRAIGIVLLLGLLGGAVTWWYGGLRNWFIPDNFGVVVPGKIYRSAQINRRILRRTLEENHIALIVDLSHEDSADARAERTIAAEMGVKRISLLLGGNGTGDPAVYPRAIKAIVDANRQGKAVLVHCQSGAQRTGGVVATYRILVEGMPRDQAFDEAKRYHHSPHSNPLLFPFVEQHLDQWKAQLQAEGILQGVEDARRHD